MLLACTKTRIFLVKREQYEAIVNVNNSMSRVNFDNEFLPIFVLFSECSSDITRSTLNF